MVWKLPAVPLPRLVAEFSEHLLAADLPRLPAVRRTETVAFAQRRMSGLPSPIRAGVSTVAVVVAGAGRVVGSARLVRFLARRPLPVVGDYVRLVRSLAFAYVWETWPSTSADGAPR